VLTALYEMPEDQRAEIEASFPQIQAYYNWKNGYLASHPAIIPYITSEKSELYGLPQDVQMRVYQYRAEKAQRFPTIDQLQAEYFSIEDSAKKRAYLKINPELSDYWDWRQEYAAEFPQAAAYILSDQSLSKAIRGEDVIPADVARYVDNFYNQRDQLFPDVMNMQDYYYSLTDKGQRREFLRAYPQLAQYWDWRRQMAAAYPNAAPYIMSDQSLQNAILNNEAPVITAAELEQFSPYLVRSLAANIYSGETIRDAAWMELEQIWQAKGEPYGDLEQWVQLAVMPVLEGSMVLE
jgi:hypothetical protein